MDSGKYQWTKHSQYKMRYYGLSPQRIKRIVRHPARTEEAVIPKMIAAMSPYGRSPEGRQPYYKGEIWVMYQLTNKRANSKFEFRNSNLKVIKIITAWRYPGKSPARDPIPREILEEIRSIV